MALKISSYFQLTENACSDLLKHTEHLLIGYPEPKDIFFFYKPLLDQHMGGKSAFYRLSAAVDDCKHCDAILLRFFLEYREVVVLIVSREFTTELPLSKQGLARQYEVLCQYAKVLCAASPETVTHLRRYSCWVNEHFPKDQLNNFAAVFLGDRNLQAIDVPLACTEKGFLFQIIEPYHYALYDRYLLMYGLLLAYQISLEVFINELAFFTIENIEGLEQLRKECAQFNAIFYFNNPVRPGNSNLRPAWNKLMQPFNMDTLTAELMDQLEAVTQIYYIEQERERRAKEYLDEENRRRHYEEEQEQEKHKQRRQDAFNLWLSIIGILLTALTIVEIKPSDLIGFFSEWKEFFVSILSN